VPKIQQFRLLAVIAAGLGILALAFTIAGHLLHPDLPPQTAAPPGTFRPSPEQLHSLEIERVGTSAIGMLTTATGMIDADGDFSTPVFLPYSGQVVRVLVDTGQKIARGQPLLAVRTNDFVDARSAVLAADANCHSLQAQLANAQRTAERQRLLVQTAGGAQKDYQQSLTDLAAAQAQERSAAAALAAARDKLAILGGNEARSSGSAGHEEVALRAPISGTIATRDVSPGQYVTAGGEHPVLTITDPSRVWLMAQLAETDASSVHVGDEAEVSTPAYPGRIFRAVIDTVSAGLDPATHRLPVRAKIANPDGALKPQMFASFAIRRNVGGNGKIYVPATAVIHEGDSARVWILRPDGLLASRWVQTGDQQGGRVEITAGLRPGEKLVTSGALFVNEAGLGQ
jgi:cobalt-zinc-cadmium efflux system membrane fusion protein